jgi:Na+/H+ antiporter NhaD/arsenite permease-like protein
MEQDESGLLKDKALLKKSVIVLLGMIAMFAAHGSLHLEVSVIALGGAGVLLVITRIHPEKVLSDVDWTTLIFLPACLLL